MNINSKDNKIIFEINAKIYPKEVIYKTCYAFIDRAFVYLDIFKKNLITVTLQGKKNLNKKQLKDIKGEFSNELMNVLLRENISKKNQKTLEYIVGGAITAALSNDEKRAEVSDLDKEIEDLKKELDEIKEEDFKNDPLGIKKIAGTGNKAPAIKKRIIKSTKK